MMVVSALVAVILSMFLIGMSAVFEMRALKRDNDNLRTAVVRLTALNKTLMKEQINELA